MQLPSKKVVTTGAVGAILLYYLYKYKFKKQASSSSNPQSETGARFLKQLKKLLPIVIPGMRTKEFGILLLHTGFLVSRTFLSIYVSKLDGSIVKALVDRDPKEFFTRLVYWLLVAIPATYTNTMIKYLQSKLSIALRSRLTKHAYELYMKNETYYRVGNLDSRLENPDQCLTEDINNFCSELAHVHSQLSKPVLDVVMNTWQLFSLSRENQTKGGGASTSFMMSALVIFVTSQLLSWARPKFGQLVAKQAELEGKLRFAHTRVITNAEEIAFYRGHEIEQENLFSSYYSLVKHMSVIFKKRIGYSMLEGFLMKYLWSATGLMMIAIPAFFYQKQEEATSQVISNRTASYVTAKNLLLHGAEAVERIMLAYKKISQLAGYTNRVTEMLDVFDDVQQKKYVKTQVTSHPDDHKRKLALGHGQITEQAEFIEFEKVPIVSPNGDVLVDSLSLTVKPGDHLLITGPNGCGKSSLFRILGGLWPVLGGRVARPAIKQMFYIPQRPYLCQGSLRDQIIYPDTVEDMKQKNITDDDLLIIMNHVHLGYVVEREGWDKIAEWKDVLSGGEKQRVGLSRLFYHKPKFAILDECTSAVSIDVEGKIYQQMIDSGITLMTVTHRPTLWKYHKYVLQFDGDGNTKFAVLNAEDRMSMKEEKVHLESQLTAFPKMQKRLEDLCIALAEDSAVLQDLKKKENK